MTDPIEQAREDLKWGGRRCECSECDTEFLARIATFEQAILHYHPDVVRLVLTARGALLVLDEILGDTDLDDDESDEFATYRATDAALVPFTEVQE